VALRLPRVDGGTVLAVFAGGIGGGLARYGITSWFPTSGHDFPWSTFAVNTSGAFALALVLVLVAERLSAQRLVRAVIGTGFIGAYTTFSSVMTSTDQLVVHGHAQTAVLYLLGGLAAGLGAVALGLLAGRVMVGRRSRGTA
jgi:CrcB protein